jgi:hypothetical protein
MKPLTIILSGVGRGMKRKTAGVILPMNNARLLGTVTMNSPIQQICPNKNG